MKYAEVEVEEVEGEEGEGEEEEEEEEWLKKRNYIVAVGEAVGKKRKRFLSMEWCNKSDEHYLELPILFGVCC